MTDLIESVRRLIAFLSDCVDCDSFHHEAYEYHEASVECPVVSEYKKLVAELTAIVQDTKEPK